ncbi:HEAT repeat domain-containing protein [Nitrosopumilus sp.]|uniref:HEAT repeat domain-containing protein n=1 Tax=Nitrosopumilus sp. TaxID=2024843 RepID=UPI003D0D06EC
MENIVKVLESGSNEEKIKILKTLDKTDNPEVLEKIISKLDDDDIKVRGEAFSSLVLNKNKISNFLIKNLDSPSKNIRGFAALALANRNETDAIPNITKLAKDERSMVRSCAIGALGYLKAKGEKEIILDSVLDTNVEVRKSALHAIINLKFSISEERIKEMSKDADSELLKMLSKLKK